MIWMILSSSIEDVFAFSNIKIATTIAATRKEGLSPVILQNSYLDSLSSASASASASESTAKATTEGSNENLNENYTKQSSNEGVRSFHPQRLRKSNVHVDDAIDVPTTQIPSNNDNGQMPPQSPLQTPPPPPPQQQPFPADFAYNNYPPPHQIDIPPNVPIPQPPELQPPPMSRDFDPHNPPNINQWGTTNTGQQEQQYSSQQQMPTVNSRNSGTANGLGNEQSRQGPPPQQQSFSANNYNYNANGEQQQTLPNQQQQAQQPPLYQQQQQQQAEQPPLYQQQQQMADNSFPQTNVYTPESMDRQSLPLHQIPIQPNMPPNPVAIPQPPELQPPPMSRNFDPHDHPNWSNPNWIANPNSNGPKWYDQRQARREREMIPESDWPQQPRPELTRPPNSLTPPPLERPPAFDPHASDWSNRPPLSTDLQGTSWHNSPSNWRSDQQSDYGGIDPLPLQNRQNLEQFDPHNPNWGNRPLSREIQGCK